MKRVLLTTAMALLAVSSASAMPNQQQDRFAEMDADANGSVTWEEFSTAMPSMRKQAFENIDTNKDNAICREEWDTFRAGHGSQSKAGMGGMGGMMPPQGATPEGAKPLIQPPSKP